MNISHINLFDDTVYFPQNKSTLTNGVTNNSFDKLVGDINFIKDALNNMNVVLETQTKTLNSGYHPQLYQPTINNGSINAIDSINANGYVYQADEPQTIQQMQNLGGLNQQNYNVENTTGTQVFTSVGINFIGLIKTNYINPFKNGNWSDICGDIGKLNDYKAICDSVDPLFNTNHLLESNSTSNSLEYQQGKTILEFVRDSMLAAYTHLNLKSRHAKEVFSIITTKDIIIKNLSERIKNMEHKHVSLHDNVVGLGSSIYEFTVSWPVEYVEYVKLFGLPDEALSEEWDEDKLNLLRAVLKLREDPEMKKRYGDDKGIIDFNIFYSNLINGTIPVTQNNIISDILSRIQKPQGYVNCEIKISSDNNDLFYPSVSALNIVINENRSNLEESLASVFSDITEQNIKIGEFTFNSQESREIANIEFFELKDASATTIKTYLENSVQTELETKIKNKISGITNINIVFSNINKGNWDSGNAIVSTTGASAGTNELAITGIDGNMPNTSADGFINAAEMNHYINNIKDDVLSEYNRNAASYLNEVSTSYETQGVAPSFADLHTHIHDDAHQVNDHAHEHGVNTGNANYAIIGAPWGSTLSIVKTTNDPDGAGTINSYKWQSSNDNYVSIISTTATYNVAVADGGKFIRCIINYTDADNNTVNVITPSVQIGDYASIGQLS